MRISEIFTSLQGEGINVGIPMTFIRVQGCSVGCGWCDTKYSWDKSLGTEMTFSDILSLCPTDWVCLTGGEPAEHPWVETLTKELKRSGKRVCVETSGVGEFSRVKEAHHLTVSPKSHRQVSDHQFLRKASEIKVVVCRDDDIDRALQYRDSYIFTPVLLQPVWGSPHAMEIVKQAAYRHNFRVSFQQHKMVGIR